MAIGGWVGNVAGGHQPVLIEEFEWLGRQLVFMGLFLFVGLVVIGRFTSDLMLAEREASKDKSFSWSSSNDIEVSQA